MPSPNADRAAVTAARWIPLVPWLLAAGVAVVYAPVGGYGFVLYDDPEYVSGNGRVAAGLGAAGIRWALTAFHTGNWHPVTWLAHMLDVSLFGMDAGKHHLVNVLLHAANCALLYRLLRRATGAAWRSAAAAALFALHPFHVESVAWISERKDVLSGFFFLAALLAYVRYREKPGGGRYLAVLLLFACGLAAKPMLVTLPFVLWLLDWWIDRSRRETGAPPPAPARRPFLDKVPLLALSAASCLLTLSAQSARGAVTSLATLPWPARLANAAAAYAWYLRKAVVPTGLAVFHPHPGASPPAAVVLGSVLALAAITAVAVAALRNRPYLAFGWSWFLGMLVPVLGLVQAGTQGVADRYAYLPAIGLYVALAWGIGEVAERRNLVIPLSAAFACAALGLAAASRVQVGYWKDSATLFSRALAVHPGEGFLHALRGAAYADAGDPARAEADFRRALLLRPDLPDTLEAYATFLDRSGRHGEAVPYYGEAIRLADADPAAPPSPRLRLALGGAALKAGDAAAAEAAFRDAVRLDPDSPEARNNLGVLLARRGDRAGAVGQFREALRIRPGYEAARRNLERAGAR